MLEEEREDTIEGKSVEKLLPYIYNTSKKSNFKGEKLNALIHIKKSINLPIVIVLL